jgi:hypothetical protein
MPPARGRACPPRITTTIRKQETLMKALWTYLTANLRLFRREWAKARRHMLEDKRRNIQRWRHAKG